MLAAVLIAPAALAEPCKPDDPSRVIELAPGEHVGALSEGFHAAALLDHEIVLTFDDGPNLETTPKILDLLKASCLAATFFPRGEAARDHPELIEREIAEGHAIGGHTWSHEVLTDRPLAAATRDILDGFRPLEAAGAVPGLFRFPQLASSTPLLGWLADRGMAAVGADIDPWDWEGKPPAETLARIKAGLDEKGRGIVILHDVQPNTLKLLPGLIELLRREGYRVVPLRAAAPHLRGRLAG